jgi:hypothetical protein
LFVTLVVDVGLHHDAVDSANHDLLGLVESELKVSFAKLDLPPTGGGTGMKKTGVVFDRELTCCRGVLGLIDEATVAPGKKAILRGGVGRVPAKLFDVVEWRALREGYLAHGLAEVEKTGKWLLLLKEIVIAVGTSCIVYVTAEKRVARFRGFPASIDEAEARFVGNEHDIDGLYVAVRERDGGEAGPLVTFRPDDDGIVVSEVIEEREIEG